MAKKRLDQILVEEAYYDSREKARTAIMSGYVKVAKQPQTKAGTMINLKKLEEDPNYIEVEDRSCPYVSRGAYKLEKAVQDFGIDLKDKLVLDIGSSTGGFTDYSLQHGARKVLAIDVGKAQLDYKLRSDKRVFSLEGKNFKELKAEELELEESEKIDLVVADLSFISIIKILDNLKTILESTGSLSAKMVFLIKPQFEAGKEIADKFKGVISDEKIRQEILDETLKQIQDKGLKAEGLAESPIKGAKGNIEFLGYFSL